MSDAVIDRLAGADLAIVSAITDDGQPWAWPLAGPPGLLKALGPELVRLLPPAPAISALTTQLARTPAVGMLAVDLQHRTAAGLSGLGAMAGERLAVAVDRAHVWPRPAGRARVGHHVSGARPTLTTVATRLTPAQQRLVAGSDVVFIATRTPAGPRVFPHHGAPGFVTAGEDGLRFSAPASPARVLDARANPRACLLFVDFATGCWLDVLIAAATRTAGQAGAPRPPVDCRVLVAAAGEGLSRRWRAPDRLAG